MKKRQIGRIGDHPVEEIVLESADAAVAIMGLGASVRDWRVDGPRGSIPVVCGFARLEDHVLHARAHGAVCGRVANRIAGGRFALGGETYQVTQNEGIHHLHGGATGLQRRIWTIESDDANNAVRLTYASPDGEEGYPGAVDFSATYRLDGPRLILELAGLPDRPTPINVAQHSYYNLAGSGDVRDHVLWIDARERTVSGADLIPTGEIRAVEETRFDFTEPRSLAENDPKSEGYDVNFVLAEGRETAKPAARVECARSGMRLELWTAEPGLQLYDSAGVTIAAPGHDGVRYGPFAGMCLEAQHFPDSLHHPDWPSIIRTPEAPYFQRLEVEIRREA